MKACYIIDIEALIEQETGRVRDGVTNWIDYAIVGEPVATRPFVVLYVAPDASRRFNVEEVTRIRQALRLPSDSWTIRTDRYWSITAILSYFRIPNAEALAIGNEDLQTLAAAAGIEAVRGGSFFASKNKGV